MFWQPIYLLSVVSIKHERHGLVIYRLLLLLESGRWERRRRRTRRLPVRRSCSRRLVVVVVVPPHRRSCNHSLSRYCVWRLKGLRLGPFDQLGELFNSSSSSSNSNARVSKINRRLFPSDIKHKSVAVVSLSSGHFFFFFFFLGQSDKTLNNKAITSRV